MVLDNSKAPDNRKPGLSCSRACRDVGTRTGRHYREDSSNFTVGTVQLRGGVDVLGDKEVREVGLLGNPNRS